MNVSFKWAAASQVERDQMIAELAREGDKIAADMSAELTAELAKVGVPYRWVMTFDLVPITEAAP